MGVLVHTPQFEPWLTAREAVDLARHLTAPELPTSRVDDVLFEVGLERAINRRVGGLSRGMLQRLGLAGCLVGDPEILLLDEPSSALDPAGRREVLDLVGRLAHTKTVILSTHILSDVQQVADVVGVIDRGRLQFQGPLTELLARTSATFSIHVRPPAGPILEHLRRCAWTVEADEHAPGRIHLVAADPRRRRGRDRRRARRARRPTDLLQPGHRSRDRVPGAHVMTDVTDRVVHRPTMTLWRLELLRLVRTHRWMMLFGVYTSLAVLSALTARYFNEIMERFGEGVEFTAAEPQPVDAIIQFVGKTSQIGILAVVVVAASWLTIDAKPEQAAFLRTKVPRPAHLLVAPYTVNAAAACTAMATGTVVVSVLTGALIGPLPFWRVVVGTFLRACYLAFAVAAVAGFTRGQATTVFGALGVLLALPIIGLFESIQPWLPSELVSGLAAIVDGASVGDFARSLLVTAIVTTGLLTVAAFRFERREL